MRLSILTAALLVPASSAAIEPQASAPEAFGQEMPLSAKGSGTPIQVLGTGICDNPNFHQAENDGSPTARRLGELPPGSLQLTVMREVDGCMEPVIVRQPFGAIEPDAPDKGRKMLNAPPMRSVEGNDL